MQSIIVYSNPVQAAFWESGLLIPILVAGVVFILVMLGMTKLFDKMGRLSGVGPDTGITTGFSFFAATIAAVLVFRLLDLS